MTRKLIEQMLKATSMLLSYTKACEGLLNCTPAGQIDIADAAITAAREYLAQPESEARTEQSEPVGYVYSQDGRKEGCIQDHSIPNGTPLYTQPKAPELTDDEIHALAWNLSAEKEYEAYTGQERLVVSGYIDFARAVLAAQGAKK